MRASPPPFFIILCCLLCLVVPANAEPREKDGSALAWAREVFIEGRTLMQEGKWREAGDKFLIAVRAKDTPGLRYYIGYCREKEGRFVEALGSYNQAVELMKVRPAKDLVELLPTAIGRVKPSIAHLQLRGVPREAQITIDGENRERAARVSLDPGEHQVLILASGFQRYEQKLKLTPGQKAIVDVELVASPTNSGAAAGGLVPGPDASEGPRGNGWKQGVFWTSTSLAALGVGTGVAGAIVFSSGASLSSNRQNVVDSLSSNDPSACFEPTGDIEKACNEWQDGVDRQKVGKILLIAGGSAAVLGAAGALLTHFLWPDAPVRVEAAALGSGLSLRGNF